MNVATHVLGPTMMPRWLMPRFYARTVQRFGDGPVYFHAMRGGGLGRTDRLVDGFRPILEAAAARQEKVRLVGHSLGGIVSWALAHEYPYAVEEAELWCAPVRGTALASVLVPVAEARFIARASRWLRRYDRPLNGTRVHAVYTALDQLAVPPSFACYVEGDAASNHMVAPYPIAPWRRRDNEFFHRGAAEHVTLPRLPSINATLSVSWT